jgi:hypothetical protein
MENFARFGFLGRSEDEPDIRDQAPAGTQRFAMAIGLDWAVQAVLSGSRRLHEELAAMRKTDEWRVTQGYPIACTPETLDRMDEWIAEADAEAEEAREMLGIGEDATQDEVIDRAMELAHAEGFYPGELDWLRGLLTHKPKHRTPGVVTSN